MEAFFVESIKCVITGALGNVAYNLIYFVALGNVFGKDTKIQLHLLEIPEFAQQLVGLKTEVLDCAFPLVEKVIIGTDPYELFADIDYAFLVGAKPRGPGMERKELLEANGKIFQVQGKALDSVAKKAVKTIVVGNPCNTNCLITIKNAPSISPFQFASLSLLDELRARAILAEKLEVGVDTVSPVVIWGNHSSTLVPDITYTKVGSRLAKELVDEKWVYDTFIPEVRNRGSYIIKLRGKSSAASAAWAAALSSKYFFQGGEQRFSLGMFSENNPYEIAQDLVFSFPCLNEGKNCTIIPKMKGDERVWNEVKKSEKELIEERDSVRHLF